MHRRPLCTDRRQQGSAHGGLTWRLAQAQLDRRAAVRRGDGKVSQPLDSPGQLICAKLDQGAAADCQVLAALEREPMYLALLGIDDQQLLDAVGGIEG